MNRVLFFGTNEYILNYMNKIEKILSKLDPKTDIIVSTGKGGVGHIVYTLATMLKFKTRIITDNLATYGFLNPVVLSNILMEKVNKIFMFKPLNNIETDVEFTVYLIQLKANKLKIHPKYV